MKSLSNRYATLIRFTLALVLLAVALVVSAVIDGPWLKRYFPFLSVILLVVVTWFLYRLDGKSLAEIGLNPTSKNLSFLFLGILLAIVAFGAVSYLRAIYMGESIALSEFIDHQRIISAFYYILPTVAVEELLFRGYLFKKTISVTNVVVANVIFALLFTLIHVADGSVISNPGRMLMLSISIPVGHLLFATALLRSRTLFFPIGLHLGNNWATRHLVSDQGDGQSILFVAERINFETWPSFIGFLLISNGVFLLVTLLIWKWPQAADGSQ